jgi:hypothetical protein
VELLASSHLVDQVRHVAEQVGVAHGAQVPGPQDGVPGTEFFPPFVVPAVDQLVGQPEPDRLVCDPGSPAKWWRQAGGQPQDPPRRRLALLPADGDRPQVDLAPEGTLIHALEQQPELLAHRRGPGDRGGEVDRCAERGQGHRVVAVVLGPMAARRRVDQRGDRSVRPSVGRE